MTSKSLTGPFGGNLLARRLDRPCRIANPFAPGAGVELSTGKTGDLEREQVVTRGYTRAAHCDSGCRRLAAQRFEPLGAQDVRRQETPLCIEVVRKGVIARTGHVAGDRIDGFVLAGKSVRRACVDQAPAGGEMPGCEEFLQLDG